MNYQIIIKELIQPRKRKIFEVKTITIKQGIEKINEKFQYGE